MGCNFRKWSGKASLGRWQGSRVLSAGGGGGGGGGGGAVRGGSGLSMQNPGQSRQTRTADHPAQSVAGSLAARLQPFTQEDASPTPSKSVFQKCLFWGKLRQPKT